MEGGPGAPFHDADQLCVALRTELRPRWAGFRRAIPDRAGSAGPGAVPFLRPGRSGGCVVRRRGSAVVSVADSGPGIGEEIRSQLFQPFITTKRHGMGIGLSISRTIIEAHGGQIWVEDTPGGGTTFRFTLRAVTKEEIEDVE